MSKITSLKNMDFNLYSRSTIIMAPMSEVLEFVSDICNLPRWATFFKLVVKSDSDRYQMETKMGLSTTWIDIESISSVEKQVIINSLFGERHESALINLIDTQLGADLRFDIKLPSDLSEPIVNSQLIQLEAELLILKNIVELK
jgi:hypothetical protein